MNKEELVTEISSYVKCSKAEAKRYLEATLTVIEKALVKGDPIRLIGFGTFSVIEKKQTKGRNPRTNEEIVIPASNKVKFVPGKQLKDSVNTKKKKK